MKQIENQSFFKASIFGKTSLDLYEKAGFLFWKNISLGANKIARRTTLCAALYALLILFSACFAQAQSGGGTDKNTANLQAGRAKYVFLFIGDGMAMPQISSAEIFSTARSSQDIRVTKLSFTRFPASGLATTYDAGSFITDSASAGTALATGHKTLNGVINMDPGKTTTYKTIAEYAHEAGMKVGVVSTVTLNHATPASFYATVPSRSNYYDIAAQLADSGFEYFAGGDVSQRTGKNNDQPDAIERAKARGYTFVNSKEAFMALKPGGGGGQGVCGETPPPETWRQSQRNRPQKRRK
ncbi:MAG: alkaline phosphatase, partial [Treponema sp.]|nr:alkaline phosphatase [Treponema sp.]